MVSKRRFVCVKKSIKGNKSKSFVVSILNGILCLIIGPSGHPSLWDGILRKSSLKREKLTFHNL